MVIDTTNPRTRRALLGAGLGALAATVASAFGRPMVADAANGPVLLNQPNNATGATSVSTTGGYDGFTATSDSGFGISGQSASSAGVYGQSNPNSGVLGQSDSGTGVRGTSASGDGVFGYSSTGTGVHGHSDRSTGFGIAVYGEAYSPGGAAIVGWNYGASGQAIGAQGTSASPAGLASIGWATADGLGVVGFSGATFPVATPRKTGVFGLASQDATSVGVRGTSNSGRGGLFAGKLAQLRLAPSTAAGHPATGAAGDLFVDKGGRLWFCNGGTKWKQLA